MRKKMTMNLRLRQLKKVLFITFASWIGTSSALANPMGQNAQHEEKMAARAARQVQKEDRRSMVQNQAEGAPQREQLQNLQQNREQVIQGVVISPARRNGRLTPEERRDLRRQINEAGQDIYANNPRH
jgi:uncharacterized membrane protein YebE (DUF533 family)